MLRLLNLVATTLTNKLRLEILQNEVLWLLQVDKLIGLHLLLWRTATQLGMLCLLFAVVKDHTARFTDLLMRLFRLLLTWIKGTTLLKIILDFVLSLLQPNLTIQVI